MKIKNIITTLEEIAPQSLALDWDNTGLIVGDPRDEVANVLLALDVDDRVIDEAINLGAKLIITHHPMIFKPVKNVTSQTTVGQWMIKLIKNDISVYTSHTNLDICNRGTNDTLFNLLELKNKEPLKQYENGYAMGRVGDITSPLTLLEFAKKVRDKLGTDILRYVGHPDSIVNRVALCGGAASDYSMFKEAVARGAQVYVTGDIRYHDTQRAMGLGLNLIDGTHFATENIVLYDLQKYLEKAFSGLKFFVSKIDLQPFKGI